MAQKPPRPEGPWAPPSRRNLLPSCSAPHPLSDGLACSKSCCDTPLLHVHTRCSMQPAWGAARKQYSLLAGLNLPKPCQRQMRLRQERTIREGSCLRG